MKIILVSLALVLSRVSCQSVDLTLVAQEVGSEVVDAVVDRISLACIFDNDKLMLRRLAQAETNDGSTLSASGDYSGGIWQISQADHVKVRTQGFAYFSSILEHLGVDISKARFTDYEKPLYSGIAASIKLALNTASSGIPWKCSDQATTWTDEYYDPSVTTRDAAKYTDICGINEDCEVPKADIIMVMDESGSIGDANFDLVKQFVVDVIGAFDTSTDGVNIGVIKYDTDTTNIADLSAALTTANLQNIVQNTAYGKGGTRTDRALLAMRDMFKAGRVNQGIPQIGIILTDGESNDEAALVAAVREISGEPFTIFSVGVTSGADVTELRMYGSDPDCLHVFTIDNFSDMSDFVSQIQQLTCKAPAELPDIGEVEGELGTGEVLYFRLKVKQTGNGVTVKLRMASGGSKMYLSWKVRNPGPAIYDYIQEVDFNSNEGGWLYIPWPSYLSSDVDETYLYGALEGEAGGLGVGNRYIMAYSEGRFSAAGTPYISVVLLFVALMSVLIW